MQRIRRAPSTTRWHGWSKRTCDASSKNGICSVSSILSAATDPPDARDIVFRMFTGIVRELGVVERLEERNGGVKIGVRASQTSAATAVGDSVALNGVCLTATEVADGLLSFEAVPETMRRTSLGRLAVGAPLNVEPALRAGEPV